MVGLFIKRLVLLVASMLIFGCQAYKPGTKEFNVLQRKEASDLVNRLIYVEDHSTGYCYAVADPGQSGVVMTIVPAEACKQPEEFHYGTTPDYNLRKEQ